MTAIEECNDKARQNGCETLDHFSRSFRDKGVTPNIESGDNVYLPVGTYKVFREEIRNGKGEITGHFEYTHMKVVRESGEEVVVRIGPSFIDRMRRDAKDNKFRFNTGEVVEAARTALGFDNFIAQNQGKVIHVEIPKENRFMSYAFGSNTEKVESFVYNLTWANNQPTNYDKR